MSDESLNDILVKMVRALPNAINGLNWALPTGPHFAAMVGASAPSPAVPEALRDAYTTVNKMFAGTIGAVAVACAKVMPIIAKDPKAQKMLNDTSQWLTMTFFSGLQAQNA